MSNEVLKVLIDEKASKIVELTKHEPKTTKELAKLLNVKNSNLYYPIKKLLEVNALKITEERQIKNMTEYYYSSAHLANEAINFDFPFITENFDQLVALNMLNVNKVFDAMAYDIEANMGKTEEEIKNLDEPNTATFSSMEVNIPYKEWIHLLAEMRKLVSDYKEKYEDETLPSYSIYLASCKNISEDNESK
ncbi:winged helix-turn-helix domain-containing protein [Macrococcus carouselicus]|uniref:ArsR family transcriptional regulator n=1 Tax=Macrococcus carouselicus TaxID=69969 RepID=A0A9Q8CLK8_9STAP|nr:helix-turn-helix domain-containing protein [Macrococcus carouselicus]TDM02213.1 ArsR family transcriptional regulator [Macrococcus carouselicus]